MKPSLPQAIIQSLQSSFQDTSEKPFATYVVLKLLYVIEVIMILNVLVAFTMLLVIDLVVSTASLFMSNLFLLCGLCG